MTREAGHLRILPLVSVGASWLDLALARGSVSWPPITVLCDVLDERCGSGQIRAERHFLADSSLLPEVKNRANVLRLRWVGGTHRYLSDIPRWGFVTVFCIFVGGMIRETAVRRDSESNHPDPG